MDNCSSNVSVACSYLRQGVMAKKHSCIKWGNDDSIWTTARQGRSILNRHNLCESHVEYMHFAAHVLRECVAPQLALAGDGPQPRDQLLHINEP